MNLQRHTVAVTTAADGTATAYTSNAVTGAILMVKYTKTNFADGVDFTITTEDTGQNIWVDTNINASETVYPRVPTHDTAGAALLYASGGTAVTDRLFAVGERIKIVIASGGVTTTGTFLITTG